jgi:flagellar export protein FliJ
LRKYEEEQKRLELGGVTSRCESIRGTIEDTVRERRGTLTHVPAGVSNADIAFRAAQEQYAERLATEASRLRKELELCESERLDAVDRYRTAKQKADILERLRERREEHHVEREKRAAHLQLDEVARTMHMRSMEEGDAHAV